ncbi:MULTISPECIES: hypothetical protein [unclassified Amycolatopsis]|uniref:hypothetical protein n=1 Tax=unclassified Amycolatopsis TaxID=2618356 RepID=UPI002875AE3B|nr:MULTISPECIES: hypothetical protein [unclassified Amycolatopsis]MDS0134872.1 hypothetical protein [Amycolatopsis sp. 505]MDS0147952.1 hypothetical protein [Amycolatopsis sp. CM201R]
MAPTAESVSDPSSPDYDPRSPLYDVTADSSSKYYVGPLTTDKSPSGDEIREMATKQIDDEIRAGWLGPVVDPVLRDKKIQELYQQHLNDAKHGLDEGLTMRENGGAPRTLWNNASHEQMNEAITQDANPATVAETSEEWVRVGNDLGTHQKTLADAINASTNNWQGDAGDAVREHLAGVGKWLGATAQGATLAGRQQEIHSQALNETQRQMVANPPVQFDLQSTNQRLMSMTDPIQYAAAAGEAMQTYRAQQAARDHAAQIMTQYDETIGAAVATPRFPAPPKLPTATATRQNVVARGGAGAGGDVQPLLAGSRRLPDAASTPADVNAAGLGAGGAVGAGIPGDGSGAGGSGFSGSGIPGAGGDGSGNSGSGNSGSGIPGGGSGAGGSGGAGFTPPNFEAPNGPGGGNFSGAGIPGSSLPHFDDSTTSSGFTPSGIPGGGGTGGGSGFTPPSIPNIPDVSGGGGTVRGGGPIPGFTPPGIDPLTGLPTGTGGLNTPGGAKMPTIGRGGGINGESIASRLGGIPGGGGGGGGSLGGIGGSGAGGSGAGGAGLRGAGNLSGGAASGAAAEAEAAAARNAMSGRGAAGAAGSPGMGGMGAGRGGKKEDDKEHKAADYLESDDPNFFAGEQAVAPPVIGDWKNQDWK